MSVVLSGMLRMGLSRVDASAEADTAEVVTPRVAVVRDAKHIATTGTLFDRGFLAVVYVDGNNLGVARSGDCSVPMAGKHTRSVIDAAAEHEEWFAHPAGFLFARGTRKSPATTKSRVDPVTLARAVDMELEDSGERNEE